MNLANVNERELLAFGVPYNKKAYEPGGIRRFEMTTNITKQF